MFIFQKRQADPYPGTSPAASAIFHP